MKWMRSCLFKGGGLRMQRNIYALILLAVFLLSAVLHSVAASWQQLTPDTATARSVTTLYSGSKSNRRQHRKLLNGADRRLTQTPGTALLPAVGGQALTNILGDALNLNVSWTSSNAPGGLNGISVVSSPVVSFKVGSPSPAPLPASSPADQTGVNNSADTASSNASTNALNTSGSSSSTPLSPAPELASPPAYFSGSSNDNSSSNGSQQQLVSAPIPAPGPAAVPGTNKSAQPDALPAVVPVGGGQKHYVYNRMDSTNEGNPLGLPVLDTPGLDISRWVMCAWAVSNSSSSITLSDSTLDYVQSLINNFTAMAPGQIQLAATANVTVGFAFSGLGPWTTESSGAIIQAMSALAGGYDPSLISVQLLAPEYGVPALSFITGPKVNYTNVRINNLSIDGARVGSSRRLSRRLLTDPVSIQQQLRQRQLDASPVISSSRALLAPSSDNSPPAWGPDVVGTNSSTNGWTKVWVTYSRMVPRNVSSLLRTLSASCGVNMNGGATDLTDTLCGETIRNLLGQTGIDMNLAQYRQWLKEKPMVSVGIRLAIGVTAGQSAAGTDALLADWLSSPRNVHRAISVSGVGDPIGPHARIKWLLTPQIWHTASGRTSTAAMLSGGAIAGIAIGSAVFAALVAALAVFMLLRHRRQQQAATAHADKDDAESTASRRRRSRRMGKRRYLAPEPPAEESATTSSPARAAESNSSAAAAAAGYDDVMTPDQIRPAMRELGDSVTSAVRYEDEGAADEAAAAGAAPPPTDAEAAAARTAAVAAATGFGGGLAAGNGMSVSQRVLAARAALIAEQQQQQQASMSGSSSSGGSHSAAAAAALGLLPLVDTTDESAPELVSNRSKHMHIDSSTSNLLPVVPASATPERLDAVHATLTMNDWLSPNTSSGALPVMPKTAANGGQQQQHQLSSSPSATAWAAALGLTASGDEVQQQQQQHHSSAMARTSIYHGIELTPMPAALPGMTKLHATVPTTPVAHRTQHETPAMAGFEPSIIGNNDKLPLPTVQVLTLSPPPATAMASSERSGSPSLLAPATPQPLDLAALGINPVAVTCSPAQAGKSAGRSKASPFALAYNFADLGDDVALAGEAASTSAMPASVSAAITAVGQDVGVPASFGAPATMVSAGSSVACSAADAMLPHLEPLGGDSSSDRKNCSSLHGIGSMQIALASDGSFKQITNSRLKQQQHESSPVDVSSAGGTPSRQQQQHLRSSPGSGGSNEHQLGGWDSACSSGGSSFAVGAHSVHSSISYPSSSQPSSNGPATYGSAVTVGSPEMHKFLGGSNTAQQLPWQQPDTEQ